MTVSCGPLLGFLFLLLFLFVVFFFYCLVKERKENGEGEGVEDAEVRVNSGERELMSEAGAWPGTQGRDF